MSVGEDVVLLSDDGNPIGTAPKDTVHHRNTPLHLGFSCYLFDDVGRVLLTRRALRKRTFPGVWTNSYCGHPLPGEALIDAVRRRGRRELGVAVAGAVCVLSRFRYRATAPDGLVENEICPVFCARADGPVDPAADEIMDWNWVPWPDLRAAALAWSLSPWACEQIPLLDAAGVRFG